MKRRKFGQVFGIRSARSDDAEAIADVHLDSRREAMPWLSVLHSREETIAYFAGHVLIHEEVLVAEVNELVVGFIALEGRRPPIHRSLISKSGDRRQTFDYGKRVASQGPDAVDVPA
jgi:hypothetical protein